MNFNEKIRNIVIPITEHSDNVFISKYDLTLTSRFFRYGYLLSVITTAYVYVSFPFALMMIIGIPILYLIENMRILAAVENGRLVIDTPFFGFKRRDVFELSKIESIRFSGISNRLIIKRTGEKALTIMASLPPGMTSHHNTLEMFLKKKTGPQKGITNDKGELLPKVGDLLKK